MDRGACRLQSTGTQSCTRLSDTARTNALKLHRDVWLSLFYMATCQILGDCSCVLFSSPLNLDLPSQPAQSLPPLCPHSRAVVSGQRTSASYLSSVQTRSSLWPSIQTQFLALSVVPSFANTGSSYSDQSGIPSGSHNILLSSDLISCPMALPELLVKISNLPRQMPCILK